MFNFRRSLFIFAGLFILRGSFAQETDSISEKFRSLPNDTNSVILILKFGNEHKRKNLDVANAAFQIAYARAKSLNNALFIAKSAVSLGNNAVARSDYEQASAYLYEGLKYAESSGNNEILVKTKLTLGNMYGSNGQTKKALDMYLEGLSQSGGTLEKKTLAVLYNNIGGAIYSMNSTNAKNIQEAIAYFMKSIQVLEETDMRNELPIKYCNLALMYSEISKFDSALVYLGKAKVIIDKNPVADDLITYYNFKGRVHSGLMEFGLSEENFMKALEESKKMGNVEWIAHAYYGLAGMYANKKDYEKAFYYSEKHHRTKDSLVNVENFAKAQDIQNKFEREKREAELNALRAEQAKNRIFNIALIVVSLLVIISGVMMYSRFRIKSESEKKLKSQNEIIVQKNKDITDSIHYSRKIQDAILPSGDNISEIFPEHFVFYRPKDIISGDFYWCMMAGGFKFFAVADCTGHGVPGALMSMLGTSLLKEIILTKNILEPEKVLNELRKLVIQALDQESGGQKDGMDMALICYDEKNRKLHFSGANNGVQLVQGNTITELRPDKQPIGIYEKHEDFSVKSVPVSQGTLVYLYTDGFADQFGGEKGKKYKYRQLNDLLVGASGKTMQEQKQILSNAFDKWRGDLEQVDDVCIAGLRI
jgi:serine phosphatase RsbU (regulator of sigma subunit)/tetratricopeptide (TPR) repeat protein